MKELTVLTGGGKSFNFVEKRANLHLRRASELLIEKVNLVDRVTVNDAYESIVDSFFNLLPKFRENGILDDRKLIDRAATDIRKKACFSGAYVVPVVFAPRAKNTEFQIGPMTLLSVEIFMKKFSTKIEEMSLSSNSRLHRQTAKDWREYSKSYDHVILVTLDGYSKRPAWGAAREVAEFFLNLIRMTYRYQHMKDLRIGGSFMRETSGTRLVVEADGQEVRAGWWRSWPGSSLKDDWTDHFEAQLGGFKELLASFAYWLTKKNNWRSPIYERLRYAHRLIAEAYCEEHHNLRLVRLVSALEALALASKSDKAHAVSIACAQAGGGGDPLFASEIYDRVRTAYHWRNMVVHGDAPKDKDVFAAFLDLEEFLIDVILSFMGLYSYINRSKPQSISALRKEFRRRIDIFAWDRIAAGW